MSEVELYDAEVVEAEIVETETRSGGLVVAVPEAEPVLSERAMRTASKSRAANTERVYRKDRELFAEWCVSNGHTVMPVHPIHLAEYVQHMIDTPHGRNGRSTSLSSIERALSAICSWHREHGHHKPETKPAREVINGYKRLLAEAKDPVSQPVRATPAVPAVLRKMLATLDRDTLKGQRDAALMLLGFAAACRASESVSIDIQELTRDEDGWHVTIYRKKVKKYTDNSLLYGTDPSTCPVRALDVYVAALREEGRTDGPLFVRIDRHGHVAAPMQRKGKPIGDQLGRMTSGAVATVVENAAHAAGYEGGRWTGHSLRRGLVTAARKNKTDHVHIARLGGWEDGSKSLLKYIEDVDRVTESPLIGIGL